MAKSVRMADIAEVMGVSTVTVSKALSGQKGVSEELRAKIRDKAEAMGYRAASAFAQERVRRNVSYTIGAIVATVFWINTSRSTGNCIRKLLRLRYRKAALRCLRCCRVKMRNI